MTSRLLFATAVLCAAPALAVPPSDATPLAGLATQFRSEIAPLLETYCLDCHSSAAPSGAIDLEIGDASQHVLRPYKVWRKVARSQQLEQMPPPEMEQPTEEERAKLIAWATSLQQALDAVQPQDPGPAIFRRLNRAQYNRTMDDLFGLKLEVAAAVGLQDDPRVFGYDSIATALEIPPLLMEKYVAAADLALARAVDTKPATITFSAAELPLERRGEMPETDSKDGKVPPAVELVENQRVVRVNAAFPLEVETKEAGLYRLRVQGWGHKGPGWVRWSPELTVSVDGQIRKSLQLLGTSQQPLATETMLQLGEGTQEVTLAFINAEHGATWQSNDHRFRHMGVEQIELTGPVNAMGMVADPAAHERIFFVQPQADDPASARNAARQIIARFASRAYRRPAQEEEVQRLLSLYDLARSRGANFESSVRPMLKAVLLSPHFLFRIETPREVPPHESYRVSDPELAVRLSYFLWGTTPDDQLTALAEAGKLSDPAELRNQFTRMLDDPRSSQLVESFAAQWLRLEELEHALPSEEFFPEFTAEARSSMRREVLMFVEHLIQEDRPVTELIDSDYTFGNRHLTRIYRMGGFQHEMERVEINKRRDPYRGGLLGMSGILAMTSHVSRNSPTRRGSWILEVMLGDPPPPPPANVEQIDEGSDLAQAKSFRQLLDLHASDSTCAACHKKMDPLGFALDNFNPIGRYETERQGQKIDASGTLPDGRQITGPVELKQLFLENQDMFVRNLTEQLLIFALGRRLEYYDEPTVARIVARVKENDYRMRELLLAVVESYPFQHRRNAEEPLLFVNN